MNYMIKTQTLISYSVEDFLANLNGLTAKNIVELSTELENPDTKGMFSNIRFSVVDGICGEKKILLIGDKEETQLDKKLRDIVEPCAAELESLLLDAEKRRIDRNRKYFSLLDRNPCTSEVKESHLIEKYKLNE